MRSNQKDLLVDIMGFDEKAGLYYPCKKSSTSPGAPTYPVMILPQGPTDDSMTGGSAKKSLTHVVLSFGASTRVRVGISSFIMAFVLLGIRQVPVLAGGLIVLVGIIILSLVVSFCHHCSIFSFTLKDPITHLKTNLYLVLTYL